MGYPRRKRLNDAPAFASEILYVGIDVGKRDHCAGFISTTLLERYLHFETCPTLRFENSRVGFRLLVDRLQTYVPLQQCYVLVERTGHYHKAVVQYLQELEVVVYIMHVQERPKGLLKTDKRDALGLANHLYNQLDRGIQLADKLNVVRQAVAPTPTAAVLRSLLQHRAELVHETTRRKNKLTAINDELFPELTTVLKDPNGATALAIRQRFPTPEALAAAPLSALQELRRGRQPSNARLVELQHLAAETIGVKNPGRQRGLILEQAQLIKELELMQAHVEVLTTEISTTIAQAREGQIVLSVPGWGPILAATLIAFIGHIDNFPTAAAFKAYCGWAPKVAQSGSSLDYVALHRGGAHLIKTTVYFAVLQSLRHETEWKRLYDRLVPKKCVFDERTRQYKGKLKVVGRIAGQMLALIYGLLKADQAVLRQTPPGRQAPDPIVYDVKRHQADRNGRYRTIRPQQLRGELVQLP
jgi:transposase